MKKLLIVLFMFASTLTFAQEQEVVKVTETERIVDKYIDKAESAIVTLAKALQVPAEHVYKVLIKQQVVYAITWSLVDIALILFTLWLSYYIWIREDEDGDTRGHDFWGLAVAAIAITILIFTLTVDIIVSGFINPEYGAIKDVMRIIAPLTN